MVGMPSKCVTAETVPLRSTPSQAIGRPVTAGVSHFMHKPAYYREQAERARRLARSVTNRDIESYLLRMAQDYDDLVEDLETGAIEIRHPELMPQQRR